MFNDDLLEGREEFGVRLVEGEGVVVRDGEARVEIVDEDGEWEGKNKLMNSFYL